MDVVDIMDLVDGGGLFSSRKLRFESAIFFDLCVHPVFGLDATLLSGRVLTAEWRSSSKWLENVAKVARFFDQNACKSPQIAAKGRSDCRYFCAICARKSREMCTFRAETARNLRSKIAQIPLISLQLRLGMSSSRPFLSVIRPRRSSFLKIILSNSAAVAP